MTPRKKAAPSAFPWNHDGGHYGLARCCLCGNQQSNRDKNPCVFCRRMHFADLAETPPPTQYVAAVDAPNDREFDFGPDERYSPVARAVVLGVRRWWKKVAA